MKPLLRRRGLQGGASLIEVLVSVLLLSFGMLSLAAMLSFAVQMPKLSGFRATAVSLASSHIDRIRANPDGFECYKRPFKNSASSSTCTGFDSASPSCDYYHPCSYIERAAMDDAETRRFVSNQLPVGDMLVNCDTSPCAKGSHGNVWIVWQEPSTNAAFDPTSSDNCPAQLAAAYPLTQPRCIYLGFTI